MPEATQPRIYLAGPEVFLPEPHAIAGEKRQLCAEFGFTGIFPLDADLDLGGLAPGEQAHRISRANEDLIRSCDLLVANLTPFRGISADSGTVYEVGLMSGLGRPVLGYTNSADDYASRADAYRAGWIEGRAGPCGDGDRGDVSVERFGLAENLMIASAIDRSGGTLVRHKAAPGRLLEDLAGFRVCLAQARALIDGHLIGR